MTYCRQKLKQQLCVSVWPFPSNNSIKNLPKGYSTHSLTFYPSWKVPSSSQFLSAFYRLQVTFSETKWLVCLNLSPSVYQIFSWYVRCLPRKLKRTISGLSKNSVIDLRRVWWPIMANPHFKLRILISILESVEPSLYRTLQRRNKFSHFQQNWEPNYFTRKSEQSRTSKSQD